MVLRPWHSAALAALVWCFALAPEVQAAEPEPRPRLVLVIAVDQLRADRLTPDLPGGLGRIAREGRVFADAAHAHADTETCPGHAVLLTGAHPGRAGVPGNEWIDRETGATHYCVEDADPTGTLLAAGASAIDARGRVLGRSPRLLRVDALGDWMKRADPKTRVFTVSGKDRAAIALGGQRPDAAYFFDAKTARGFTSSRYYLERLPDWVSRWHGEAPLESGWLRDVPERWEHPSGAPANGARADDFPGEIVDGERQPPWFTRTSPHPLRAPDLDTTLARLYFTPWLDTVTLSFVRTLIEREDLGSDDATDLLAVSLSATDLIGHAYGPGSQEARDALLRLDRELGELLDFVAARVGSERLLVALSADHGVLELPEALAAVGENECPSEVQRVPVEAFAASLQRELVSRFGPVPAAAAGDAQHPRGWVLSEGFGITVNRAATKPHGPVSIEQVAAATHAWLSAQPGVAYVFTADEIVRGGGPEAFRRLAAHSFDPERSGDLVLIARRDCLFSRFPTGTTHGTPYLYDRAVPLVVSGPGVGAGVVRGRAAPVDLGPTLAAHLGIPFAADRDGQPLALIDR